jgi:hypothetical protein
MQNKHILIVIKYGSFYGYCESIIKELAKKNKVTLCIQNENNINASKYFINHKNSLVIEDPSLNKKVILASSNKNFIITKGIRRTDSWVKPIIIIRETLNYLSFQIRGENNTFFENQTKYVSKKVINFLKLLKFRLIYKIVFKSLKFLHSFVPPSAEIKKFISKINPDCIIVVGGNWPTRTKELSSEIDFIHAANKLNISSILQVISWDNLIARGLYHYNPTLMLVWNKNHFNEALKIHKIPQKKLRMIGAPFMDKWFDKNNIKSKTEFYKEFNLEFNKPLVTYLGSAKNISKNEKMIVEKIFKKLSNHGYQMIVRPHGSNSEQFLNLDEDIKIIPTKGELPDTDDSKRLMIETLKYSDFTIGINTTAMIDSIILGTPCISLIKEEFSYNQMKTPHFYKVKNEGIFIEAIDEEESVIKIIEFNKNKDSLIYKKMDKFVENFCRPHGKHISAGKKTFDEISKLLNQAT